VRLHVCSQKKAEKHCEAGAAVGDGPVHVRGIAGDSRLRSPEIVSTKTPRKAASQAGRGFRYGGRGRN
jgi:hypothetical protein